MSGQQATRGTPGPLPPERAGSHGHGDPSAITGHGDRPRTGGGTHRARSPIIAPGLAPAAMTCLLAALLAVTAPLPRPVLAACAVVPLQALTAAGWFRLNGMWPARQGIALAFLAGVAADAALLVTGREHIPTVLLGTLGVWCVLALVLQLRNRSDPDERLYALTAAFASTALTVTAACHLAAAPLSEDAVTTGGVAVAAGVLVRALPLPAYVSPVVAWLAAAGGGAAVHALVLAGSGVTGALVGAATGGCALVGLRVASYDFPSRFVHMTAGVALPLALAGPVVYAVARILS